MNRLHRSDSRTAGLGADEPGSSRLFGCPARSTVERVRGSAFLAGIVLVLAILAEPSAAQRMQTFDARGRQIDLLGGVTTWVRSGGADSFLMRRIAGRTRRIPGTQSALNLHGVDLGLDRAGRVVLIYGPCRGGTCRGPLTVDVRRGGERRLKVPVRRGCRPGVTASVWLERTAYGLRCRSGGSGVYLTRNGRTRRVLELSYNDAKAPRLDLSPEYLVIDGRAFSTGETICELLFREPARARYESSAVEVNGGRVWWIRELVGDFGGGDSELLTAALGPACRVRRLGEPQPLGGVLPSQPPFADSLAIAGNTFYVGTLDEGLLVGRLPKALKRRREEGIR
jgi:hypothetical protein